MPQVDLAGYTQVYMHASMCVCSCEVHDMSRRSKSASIRRNLDYNVLLPSFIHIIVCIPKPMCSDKYMDRRVLGADIDQVPSKARAIQRQLFYQINQGPVRVARRACTKFRNIFLPLQNCSGHGRSPPCKPCRLLYYIGSNPICSNAEALILWSVQLTEPRTEYQNISIS